MCKQFYKTKILLFISGFTILSLEILGIRILGPYVGNTAPVWAALMGTMLIGSAVGYYCGGILADRIQRKDVFLWLAIGSSVFIILIPTSRGVMSLIPLYVSNGISAIAGSIFLFFVPNILLSTIITYTICVFVKNFNMIVRVHSDLYALATIGSIVGVFGTSYLLVPFFTIPQILYGLGITLLLCGVLVYFSSFFKKGDASSKTSAD